ncbi:MAG: TVP38/TMEM64 family protein [Candidatus Woesearchaeota archaeon]|nr:TVP38/TMEM64 family protein [Candidatus Woesearchaeota archaeon]MDP7323256.1 TVP38/TMEM64 family protein [Candidatus Woesearchaeota archaeon]
MDQKVKEELGIQTIIGLIFIIGSLAVIGYYAYVYWDLVSSPNELKTFIASFGIFGPLALFSIEILQVVIPYLPGQVLSIAGGYLYGVWMGTLINLIAITIGSLFAFFISKKFGRPLIERMFHVQQLDKFDTFFHRHGLIIIFLCRTQFFFPNDLISYASGLINELSWKKFLVASVLGYIPHFLLLASLGEELQYGLLSAKVVSYVMLIIFMLIIYIFREPIYKWIHHEEDVIKKDVQEIEKTIIKEERFIEGK